MKNFIKKLMIPTLIVGILFNFFCYAQIDSLTIDFNDDEDIWNDNNYISMNDIFNKQFSFKNKLIVKSIFPYQLNQVKLYKEQSKSEISNDKLNLNVRSRIIIFNKKQLINDTLYLIYNKTKLEHLFIDRNNCYIENSSYFIFLLRMHPFFYFNLWNYYNQD